MQTETEGPARTLVVEPGDRGVALRYVVALVTAGSYPWGRRRSVRRRRAVVRAVIRLPLGR
jgi:hypothetical protein